MKVLFITPWYPSAIDSMSGLFVEKIVREAEHRGADCRMICTTGVWSMAKETEKLVREWGKPDLVHLHVTTKQGLVPLLMKRIWGIPYIVTEHWSGYLPANGDYERQAGRFILGRIYRWMTQKIIRKADVVTAVSDLLRKDMLRCGLDNQDFRVIHNVVDPLFEDDGKATEADEMTFLHVSCFSDRAKNVKGIIEAARVLSENGVNFRLTMVGEGPDMEETKKLSSNYGLQKYVRFTGVLQSDKVADEMRKHQCLILFSNFETAAVVLQEAMSMGMKIISTPVGIAGEYGTRIKLIPTGDINALADAMANVKKITNTRKISFSKVGEEYFALYQKITK